MVARLRELLQSESVAMLQRMDGTTITGVVRAVAADNVELVAGSSQSIIPISAVVAISA